MRVRPDNNKEGFKGYALEEQLHEYEYGRSHLVLHDTLGCPSLRGTNTITVWSDNINDKQEIFLHAGCA